LPEILRQAQAPLYGRFLRESGRTHIHELRRLLRQRSHHKTVRLRQRRMAENSWESTSNPKGIIQKPRIGKKPNRPNTTNTHPMTILSRRERGIGMLRPNTEIFRAAALQSCSTIILARRFPICCRSAVRPQRNRCLYDEVRSRMP
jgi:hypothetical protein